MIAQLEARTRAAFDGDTPNATHLDYVEQWLEAGRTMKDLAGELSAEAAKSDELAPILVARDEDDDSDLISGEMIVRYLRSEYGDDASDARLSQARARASYVLGDQALAIADAVDPEAGAVAKARLQVGTRQWLMERFNPDQFGAAAVGASVTISISALHLEALRATPRPVTPAGEVTPALPGAPSVAIEARATGALLSASNVEVIDDA